MIKWLWLYLISEIGKMWRYNMSKILLITEETFGSIFSHILQEQGYEVNVIEAYLDLEKVYRELS